MRPAKKPPRVGAASTRCNQRRMLVGVSDRDQRRVVAVIHRAAITYIFLPIETA